MSTAAKKFSEAERDRASEFNPLIDTITPRGTLENCADVVDFVGSACDAIEHNGGADFGPAVCHLLATVKSALAYEAVRIDLHYKGKGGVQ